MTIRGKGLLPMAGEYTGQAMLDGVSQFLKQAAPDILPGRVVAPNYEMPEIPDISKTVPIRPPSFCTGCPERPIFAAMKLVEQELGEHQITGDIGCHLFCLPAAVRNRRIDDGLRARAGFQRGV